MMERIEIARALREVARYLEIAEENRFKIAAFRKAARAVETFDGDLGTLVTTGEIRQVPGIGKAIGPMVVELVTTGSLRYLDELRRQYPPGVFELGEVPGLGLKKIGLLYERLGISTMDDLERAAREHRLAKLEGFGPKTEEKILQGIDFVRTHAGRFRLETVLDISDLIAGRLEAMPGVASAFIAGSVRRRLEIVRNLNFVVGAEAPADTVKHLLKSRLLEGSAESEPGVVRGHAGEGLVAEIVVCAPDEVPSQLLFRTGTSDFVASLRERAAEQGVRIEPGAVRKGKRKLRVAGEEAIFQAAGTPYVPPERRETADALDAHVPTLVTREDIRGTFHVHTRYSDGVATVEQMLRAAKEAGFTYVGISDHSPAAHYAGGLDEARLAEQQREIDSVKKKFPALRVFKGTEADILADGSIDYGDAVLSRFDFVVASIHSRFKMAPDEMTQRVLRALECPYVTFLGHLTGRLLLSREGYELDFGRVFEAAARNGVMIEINGDPHRLDIDWRLIGRALDAGVGFSIHPDAHSTTAYEYVDYGVWVARKGGVPRERIFNTRPVEEVEEYLSRRKAEFRSRAQPGTSHRTRRDVH